MLLGLALSAGAVACGAGESVSGSGGRNAPEHRGKPFVVLVSLDGVRHDYLDLGLTPNLDRIAAAGVRADALVPVFPTMTFPTHYSMATGMYPQDHGLVDNVFHDPDRDETYHFRDRAAVEDGRWYGGEPIWVTAEKQAMVSAAYFWVGTEAPIQGIQPTHWFRYDADVGKEARVDQVLAWLGAPAEERPHLVLLYFAHVDTESHRHGPDSPEVHAALASVDAAVGRLLGGVARLPVAEDVHVIVVSDHGLARAGRSGHSYLEDLTDLTGVRLTVTGPYATLWVEGDTAAAAARIAGIRADLQAGLRNARVYRRDEIPGRLRYAASPRTGHLLVLAEPGYLVGTRERLRSADVGQHGYDPAHPAMHGIFLAAGPRFRRGARLPAFEQVHLYALVAEILGLEPNPEAERRLDILAPALRDAG